MKLKIFLGIVVISFFAAKSNGQVTETLNDLAQSILTNKTPGNTIRFAVIGDSDPKSPACMVTPTINPYFTDILDEIEQVSPDFVINCGDLVNADVGANINESACVNDGYDASWAQLACRNQYQTYYNTVRQFMLNTDIAFLSVPGNHDFTYYKDGNNNGFELYREFVGADLNYSVDFGNCTMIGVNNVQQESYTSGPWNGDYRILPGQLSDIENWMQNAQKNIFTFGHVPYSEVSYKSCGADLDNACNAQDHSKHDIDDYGAEPGYREMHELHKDYNVRINFSGHQHYYRYANKDGVDYIISGGAAPAEHIIDPDGASAPEYDPPYAIWDNHWLLVTVNDCEINVEIHVLGKEPTDILKNNWSDIFSTKKSTDYYLKSIPLVQNLMLSGLETQPRHYKAGEVITSLNNGYSVVAGNVVLVEAKNKVKLLPDTKIALGSKFVCRTDDDLLCKSPLYTYNYSSSSMMSAQSNERKSEKEVSDQCALVSQSSMDSEHGVMYKTAELKDQDSNVEIPERQIIDINIYPNPAKGLVYLQSFTQQIESVDLLNSIGLTIESYPVNNTKFKLDLKHKTRGIYFLKVNSGNGKDIVKQLVLN